MLRKVKIADRIWAIYSDTEEEIGKAFVRFQEYYENKDLKGTKNITVKMIEDWWREDSAVFNIDEPYYTFWEGFNLPGKVILTLLATSEFRSGFSLWNWFVEPSNYPRWHKEEDQFIDLLQDLSVDEIIDGYFIGMWKDATEVFDHELAHALYATNPAYKAAQVVNLSKLPNDIYDKLRLDLIESGYHPSVVHDEAQAYLSTYTSTLSGTFETHDYDAFTAPFEETFSRILLSSTAS